MNQAKDVCVVEDDAALARLIEATLRKDGFDVQCFENAEDFLDELAGRDDGCTPAVLLTDVNLPGMSGLELLAKVSPLSRDILSIVMTGEGSIETAIEALRQGAVDYVQKPLDMAEVTRKIFSLIEHRELVQEVTRLRSMLRSQSMHDGLVGNSTAMEKVRSLVGTVATARTSVMLRGETGVGKEVVARAIHQQSAQNDEPFVAINCAAIPENLIESELFGHTKGAFTGAERDKEGLFTVADKGSLFLDEIGDLDLGTQAKLLRVLESRELTPVGGTKAQKIDVRVIAATNRDLREMVKEGSFREDLFYRLNVLEIVIPPLRDRIEDIPALVQAFIKEFNRSMTRNVTGPERDTLDILMSYGWPGNIRELRNAIERAMLFHTEGKLQSEYLPPEIVVMDSAVVPEPLDQATRVLVGRHISAVLKRCEGNRSRAAEVLGVDRSTLYRKMNEYEIS